MHYIIIACWIIFIAYWTVSARSVKPVQETKREFSNSWLIAGRLFFAFLFLADFVRFPILPFTLAMLPSGEIMHMTGVVLMVLGLIVAIIARRTLAKNWSGNIELKKDHELMTTGLYGYVRHPIYTGILLMSFGTLLFTGRISALLFFLVMLFFMLFKLKEEEELLAKHFPNQYPDYRKRVKALIPYLF